MRFLPNILTLVVACCVQAVSLAADSVAAPSNPDYYIVDTRSISGTGLAQPEQALQRLVVRGGSLAGCSWSIPGEELDSVLATAEARWIVVHGNRMDRADAEVFMRGFLRTVHAENDRNVFILWSWPAAPAVRGIARDSRVKAFRSDQEAGLLAEWLKEHPSPGDTVLVGYSFGARTILKALTQYLADQESSTDQPPNQADSTAGEAKAPAGRWTLILLAAAVDPGSLAKLAHLVREKDVPLSIVLTVNYSDPALRWYQHLFGCRSSQALGFTGPWCNTFRELGTRLEVLNVTSQVGRTHRWRIYLASPAVRSALHTAADSPDTSMASVAIDAD